jgi:hypothetical protein
MVWRIKKVKAPAINAATSKYKIFNNNSARNTSVLISPFNFFDITSTDCPINLGVNKAKIFAAIVITTPMRSWYLYL